MDLRQEDFEELKIRFRKPVGGIANEMPMLSVRAIAAHS
jgi:hypothetical protein